ncbi:hypothetical protein [Paraburkholderia hospita]|jgi:hypothetical protein|uniref:hypothetical protein n=2 Tax=Paraburkholderia TaxID=1822464 RepID=UPI0010549876|nr:hypothetical protein [Paraburkholderia hospita]
MDYSAKAVAVLSGNWWLLLLNADIPMRAEPDDQHGNVREFGLDMTGNTTSTPGQWRVVNPCPGCTMPGDPGQQPKRQLIRRE